MRATVPASWYISQNKRYASPSDVYRYVFIRRKSTRTHEQTKLFGYFE